MDEVGVLLGCNPPFNITATLGQGNLSTWWNIQAAVWALYIGELSAAGVDMVGCQRFNRCTSLDMKDGPEHRSDSGLRMGMQVGCSQFVGWPVGPPGTPVGIPAADQKTGCPFQSQVSPGGNCPEMSTIPGSPSRKSI
jgi:hypothetical protein